MNIEAARKREIKPGNLGLPKGAKKNADPEIAALLKRAHTRELQLYATTRACANGGLNEDRTGLKGLEGYELEVSSCCGRLFGYELNPQVEGYDWYRGVAVKVNRSRIPWLDKNQVFIFIGWMQPWVEGGAPDPIVYTRGRVSKENVLEVVTRYTE